MAAATGFARQSHPVARTGLDDTARIDVAAGRHADAGYGSVLPGPRLRRRSYGSAHVMACAAAMLVADLVALVLAFAGAVLFVRILVGDSWPLAAAFGQPSVLRSPATAFAVTACGVIAYLVRHNHYSRRVPFWTELQQVLVACLYALMFGGFIGFLLEQRGSRSLMISAWLLFPVLSILLRRVARQAMSRAGQWQIRTVVVGDPRTAAQSILALRSERSLGYDVVGIANPGEVRGANPARRWRALMEHHKASLLVLSCDAANAPGRATIEALVRERVPFAIMPPLDGLPVLGFDQTRFFSHDTVMFSYRNNLAQPMSRATKIAFDWLAASAGLLLLTPLLLIVAALVKLDGGPVFFAHTRIGAGGRNFRCLKFRSMAVDSEKVLRHLLATDPEAAAEWAEAQKLRRDPRITAVGRILRATSLDELPQLFNVMKLEMSLVGPRPIVRAEVERYGDDIAYYYETRPGLTGLWQVSGRNDTSYEYRVQLDTWYVKNWTIWHDLAIIAKTVPAVLQRRGAC